MRAMTLAAALLACGGSEAKPSDGAAPAKSAAAQEVGYDVRRLRPKDGETLDAMFDRLRVRAVDEGKRVAVLFSADWCEPCRGLELELGNMHPADAIGDLRVFTLKEEDWERATRMGEFNNLRRRWYKPVGSYPVFVLLDDKGEKIEEMKEAIARLEAAGQEPTVLTWLRSTRS